MKDANITLPFLSLSSKDPREVQASDGDGKQLNGLKNGTALRAFRRRVENKMKAQKLRGLVHRSLPRGEKHRQDE